MECDGGGPGETMTKQRSDSQVRLCSQEGQIQARRLESQGPHPWSNSGIT